MTRIQLQLITFSFLCLFVVSCNDNSFLSNHWNHPIPIQMNPSLEITDRGFNLDPKNCSSCHSKQFTLWQLSFHAKSIGNGLLWQKEVLSTKEFNNCLNCHSPVPETKAILSETFQTKETLTSQNKHFPEGITNPSIQCVSCHIRNQIWYGPPSRENKSNERMHSSTNLPHNGFELKSEFESSEFCKSCHESPDSGITLNGKHLMEVYKEWQESSFAKEGVQCQNCHMPNREHSWKGIHDPEFVRSSIKPFWYIKSIQSNQIQIHAELKSIAVGHMFPTYLIPKLYLRFYTVDPNGKRRFVEESIVGRLVNTNLSEEYYDTRIPPGGSHKVNFQLTITPSKIKRMDWVIEVDPDEHYVRSFEESFNTKANSLSEKSKLMLKHSLSEKKESRYILFTLSLPMPVSLPR